MTDRGNPLTSSEGMRRLRRILPNSLVEVTCRTFQNHRLLRPSPVVRDLILGVLGRAQRRYGMEIHAPVFLSTHYHLLVTARDAQQLARFMGYVNSNVAREIGRLLGWRDKFWGRRYEAIPVSQEEAAQVGRLRYLLAHGVKEGLVVRPEEWPGVHPWPAVAEAADLEGTWFDRTREYELRRAGKAVDPKELSRRECVVLTPLPCWRELDRAAVRKCLEEIVASIVAEGESQRSATGRPAAGVASVLRRDPRSRAPILKKTPAPWVHAVSREVREQFRDAYRHFVEAFRIAAEELKAGNRQAHFPPGSFPPALPWVGHGAS